MIFQAGPFHVTREQRPKVRSASIRAGVLAGVAGLAVFLVAPHIWLVPIWFVAPAGALLAPPEAPPEAPRRRGPR